MRYFIGLGNPGKKYAHTRHNFGFLVVEGFAQAEGWKFHLDRNSQSKVAHGMFAGKQVDLLLPQTYMNLSGWAVKSYIDEHQIDLKECLIVCDDVALEFGTFRLRSKGSSGGHNGLKSVAIQLGTEQFSRLRIGIKNKTWEHKVEETSLADFVLSDFDTEESAVLKQIVERGVMILKSLVTEPIEKVMSR